MSWRHRKWQEVGKPYEGMLFEAIPARVIFWFALLRPGHYFRYVVNRFKLATLMIGDRLQDPSRDMEWEVLEAKPGRPVSVIARPGFGHSYHTELERDDLARCRVS